MWSVDMAVDPVPGSTEPVFSAIARQTAVLLVVISKPKARLSYPERPTMSEGRSEQRGAINPAEFSGAAPNAALGARVARGYAFFARATRAKRQGENNRASRMFASAQKEAKKLSAIDPMSLLGGDFAL